MLYDPKWNKKVKSDPASLEALIAWLEQQPDQKYIYGNCTICLAAQYNAANGIKYNIPPVYTKPRLNDPFEYKLEWIALGWPRTTSGALERARKFLAEEQI